MTIPRRSLLGAALAVPALLAPSVAAAARNTAAQTAATQPAMAPPAAKPAPRDLVLGTGAVTGLYLPVGAALCSLANRDGRVRCLVEATEGSVFNLNALRAGEIDLAIAQSDWVRQAFTGEGRFAAAGPFADLRTVLTLHAETLAILATPDSGIAGFADLKGRTVNAGPAGSAVRTLFETVARRFGWTDADLAGLSDLPPDRQGESLCDGRAEAVVFAAGHPNGAVMQAVTGCSGVFVPIEGAPVEALVAERSDLVKAVIPGGLYPGADEDVPSVGVAAMLVTAAAADEGVIHDLTRSILDRAEDLGGLHPALRAVGRDTLAGPVAVAPRHPGAERALTEAGLASP
ncbi:TAXI family TRAP transporter solute-binding subunit [Rhodocista pekingensis]|uniref:TAXI family TRAP transporter solute-binding subunit n=1 Tax=Rhodocista pekingensis TaxID=201185 RepID=A0ABW2KQK5_9PROT